MLFLGLGPAAGVSLQDIALPLVQDPRFEEDTLFMVFEEDFRFAQEKKTEDG